MRLPPLPPTYSPSYPRPPLPGTPMPAGYYPYARNAPYVQSEEELKQQALAAQNNYFYRFYSGNGSWGHSYWNSGNPWSSSPYQNTYYWPNAEPPASASGNYPSAPARSSSKPGGIRASSRIEDMNWSDLKAKLQEQKKAWDKKQADKKLQAKNFAEKARLEKAKAASKPATKTSAPTVGKASSRGGFGVHGSSGHASAAA